MKNVLASGMVGFNVGGNEGDTVVEGKEDVMGVGFMLTVGADDGSSIRNTFSTARTMPVSSATVSAIAALFSFTCLFIASAVSGGVQASCS